MASSLRKRLSKRHATSNLKTTSGEPDQSSAGSSSSHEDIKAILTLNRKAQEPISEKDIGSAPPPPPAKSPRDDQPWRVSPPQSLLDRYKLRTAKVPPVTSTVHSATSKQSYQVGKDTAFTEDFEEDSMHKKSSAETSPSAESSKDTRMCRGVQFEMLRKKNTVGQAPVRESREEAAAHEPRRTRSQTRREQRTDSLGDSTKAGDFAVKDSRLASYGTTATNDNAIPRTPPPRASANTMDEITSTPSSTLVCPPSSQERTQVNPSKPLPIDFTHCSLPFDNPLRPKPLNPGHRRTKSVTMITVMPPSPTADTAPLYVWTSTLPSTSRPTDVWLPAKRWTCCMCPRLDPGRRAADTIVEQTVCSRLACGHERCLKGCMMNLGSTTC